MIKASVGIDDLRKATQAMKKKVPLFRRAVKMPSPTGGRKPLPTGVNKDLMRKTTSAYHQCVRDMDIPTVPGIYMKGDAAKAIHNFDSSLVSPKDLNPLQRESFNRLVGLHEGWEATHKIKRPEDALLYRFGSHADPDVVLRESNVLATLPEEEYKPVIDSFKKMRDSDTTAPFLESTVPGFKFGKTRLSSRGRKRVAELVRARARKMAQEELGDEYREFIRSLF